MILPSIEDENRYSAPPEPREERWIEPEEYISYDDDDDDQPEPEPTTDTP